MRRGRKLWFLSGILLFGCSADDRSAQHASGDVGSPDTSEMDTSGPKKVENPTFDELADSKTPGSSSPICEEVKVVAEREVANVMVLLDRSGSMYSPGSFFSNEVDKWSPAVRAITGAVDARSKSVAFGLMKFGTGDACAPGQVDVMPQVGAGGMVSESLQGRPQDMTGGLTPTAESLAEAGEAMATLDGESYLLLVTDGAPNCNTEEGLGGECKCPSGDCEYWEQCLDDDRTVKTIEELADNGVKTFVIGYDTGALTDVLNRMAVAGDTGATQYIAVNDQNTLSNELASLTSQVASCSYELEKVPSDIRYVSVQLGGEQVDHESIATDGGWRLEGNSVEILGSDCETLQAQDRAEVDITVQCEQVLR